MSETHTTFIKTTDIPTIFRKNARRQGGMGKSLHVAKDSYNRVLFTFISV